MLALILLTLGIVSRCIFHAPNFTPVIAIVLFSGIYLERKYAVLLPLALMIISDVMIGFYDGIVFTWLAVLGCAYIGLWVRNHKNLRAMFAGSLLASFVFFLISNFGVWASGYYGYSGHGLVNCFVAAIPFYRDTLASTLIYGFVLFGIYEWVALKVKGTQLARVLLKA